jgi:hypothetical protein
MDPRQIYGGPRLPTRKPKRGDALRLIQGRPSRFIASVSVPEAAEAIVAREARVARTCLTELPVGEKDADSSCKFDRLHAIKAHRHATEDHFEPSGEMGTDWPVMSGIRHLLFADLRLCPNPEFEKVVYECAVIQAQSDL